MAKWVQPSAILEKKYNKLFFFCIKNNKNIKKEQQIYTTHPAPYDKNSNQKKNKYLSSNLAIICSEIFVTYNSSWNKNITKNCCAFHLVRILLDVVSKMKSP